MHSFQNKFKQLTLMLISTSMLGLNATGSDLNESEQLAVVKRWLPVYQNRMQLIFEYDSEKQENQPPTAGQMHKAVDRAGPTVVIVQAQTAYEDKPRTIGGYNPYKWKTWLGRYESNAGRFIFDIDKEQKWERNTKRIGSFSASPDEYGLCFGDGDLIINPDIASGSARNSTFSNASNGSVLIGQAGDFLIKSLRVYRVMKEDESAPPPQPLQHLHVDYTTPSPNPVPDGSNGIFEIPLLIALIAFARRFFKKRAGRN